MSRRVLFDRNVPRPSREHLTGCIVRTTDDEGWSTLTNGELLAAVERSGFDVMVTGDNNLRYQQNLSGRALALVVSLNPAWPVVRHGLALVVDAVTAPCRAATRTCRSPDRHVGGGRSRVRLDQASACWLRR